MPTSRDIIAKYWSTILLTLIIVTGLLLRLYHLDFCSLWFDEIITLGRIQGTVIHVINQLEFTPFPPLYYIFLHFWLKITGISEFSLRFPSMVISVLSIAFLYRFSKELYGKQVALISAVLLAVSSYNITYAQDGKMYSMLWFFSILSFYYFYRFTQRNKIQDLILYVFATSVAMYTSYGSLFFIVIQNLLFFLVFFNMGTLGRWVIMQLLLLLFYMPWIQFLFGVINDHPMLDWIPRNINYFSFLSGLISAMAEVPMNPPLIHAIMFWLICCILISVFIVFRAPERRLVIPCGQADFLLLAWVVVPIMTISLVHYLLFPLIVMRYIGFIHIPLLVLLAKGLSQYQNSIKIFLLTFIVTAVLAFNVYPYFKYHLNYKIQAPEDWRSAFDEINAKRTRHTFLINLEGPNALETHFCQGLEFYTQGQKIVTLTYVQLLKDIQLYHYDRIFIIFYGSYGEHEINIKGYQLIKTYLKNKVGYLLFKNEYV